MKRKIEDYKKQKIAIYCSSKEEWDKIDNLFGKKGLTRDYGDINNPDNMFVDCIHINRMGTASKEWYEQKGYIVYPASDFLETEIIPEYVEYIDTKYKGQIVKVEEWTSHSFCCIRFENGQREQPFKHLVKSSTKDAYEAQNKPKQLAGNNLLPNKIYVTDDPTDYIFKTSETSKGYSHYICKFKCFRSILNKDYIWGGNLRLATKEEEKWLNTCILQNKFIPKEDLHLYDDYGLLVKTNEKMKSILEEAKERYPIGTKFKSVVTRNLFTVESHVNEAKNSNIAFHTIESNSSGNHWGCVYENGTWAEIVSLPNEQVQKEKSLVEQVKKGLKLNGEDISKSFEVSSYYEFDGKSFNQDIYIPSITKNPKKLQTITIESTTDLNLGLTKIKSKQIQTIKI